MTHMHIPTMPTARDRRLARQAGGTRRRIDVDADSTGPYDVTDYPGRHRAHRLDRAPDGFNTARCTGRGDLGRRDLWADGCSNSVCPKHAPEAYADCMARHTPETLVERAGVLLTLAEAEAYLGTAVDVNL